MIPFIKITSFIIALATMLSLYGQTPTMEFDPYNPDIKYLEHLIKEGIDQVREEHGLTPLVNDSILYVAADDHSKYLKDVGRLSHKQPQNRAKFTPQHRATFYGAKNYHVGENIALTNYGGSVELKTGEQVSTQTYGGIAKVFVVGWVNSPGHYQNIITPEYEVTGISVSVDIENETIYACQKFAQVDLRFIFEENTTMFPYSTYTPPTPRTSFDGVERDLLPKHKYPYQLLHNQLEKCAECPNKFDEAPDISLRYDERRGFILKVENSSYVQKLIRNRKDGFAVEIVDFDDYACGNSAYYEKPSRRNGQTRLNGKILEPKFRKSLQSGYKKRRKIKDMRFIDYIFRKDSVRFFKRFGQYNTDKYSSEYFEIPLGKLPKNSPFLFNHNLVVIKDKQICDIYYFTNYCGDLFEAYKKTDFIPYQYDDFDYRFSLSLDSMVFSIPFQQGEVHFEADSILEHISHLSNYDFYIDSVKIHAYSSIEGDSTINAALQLKRAENIAAIFQGVQDKEIGKSIQTSINWEGFRKELRKTSEGRQHLRNRNIELLAIVNRNPGRFEQQLFPTRKGDTKIYFHVIPNLKSLAYYVNKEFSDINNDIRSHMRQRYNFDHLLDKMADLYRYTYAMVKKGYLEATIFKDLVLPSYKDKHPELLQLYLLFGSEFNELFSSFPNWSADSTYYMNQLIQTTKTPLIPEFNYLTLKIITDRLIHQKSINNEEYKLLRNKVESLENYYKGVDFARTNMDKMNFNLNMLAINHFFKNQPEEQQHNAIMSVAQIYEYYNQEGILDDTLALHLAKIATYYQNPDKGIDFVRPFQYENDAILAFVNEVSYTHPSEPLSFFYYEKLISDFEKMERNTWCNMFFKKCGIPFQSMDYEPLRVLYCEECVGRNEYLNELYFGDF